MTSHLLPPIFPSLPCPTVSSLSLVSLLSIFPLASCLSTLLIFYMLSCPVGLCQALGCSSPDLPLLSEAKALLPHSDHAVTKSQRPSFTQQKSQYASFSLFSQNLSGTPSSSTSLSLLLFFRKTNRPACFLSPVHVGVKACSSCAQISVCLPVTLYLPLSFLLYFFHHFLNYFTFSHSLQLYSTQTAQPGRVFKRLL